MFEDLSKVGEKCKHYIIDKPTQPNAPPEPLPDVQYPFQQMCGDYMQVAGYAYLVLVDRYSGWPMVIRAQRTTTAELISREFFQIFGICEEFVSDGGSQFTSREIEVFFRSWGIKHRLSSAYVPHGNTRAEVGVKSMKRLIRNNLGPGGSLDNDWFSQAIMEYRNTPDRDMGCLPAQVVFS